MLNLLHRLENVIGILFLVILTSLPFNKVKADTLPNPDDISLNIKNGSRNAYSATEAQLLNNATQIEGFTTNCCNPFSPEFRTSWAGDRSRSRITEILLKTRYIQYNKTSKNVLVNYRKSDLIFPFHYYW